MAELDPFVTTASEPGDRQAPRFPFEWPVAIEVKKGTRTGKTRNVSSGGMFVEIDPPLDLGRIYTLTIDIAGYRPVQVDGKVVWSISNPGHDGTFAAVPGARGRSGRLTGPPGEGRVICRHCGIRLTAEAEGDTEKVWGRQFFR